MKKQDGQVKKQDPSKPEKKEADGLNSGQSVVMALGGLGLLTHAVEASEHLNLSTQQGQGNTEASINLDPASQIKPSKAFKPR